MEPCKLTDNNAWFGADQAGVRPVSVTRWVDGNGTPVISVGWRPDQAEIRRMLDGLPLIVDIQGDGMPPIWVRVAEEAE